MCESPKIVRNQYTHEWLQVPCGHCAGCVTTQNYQRTMVLDRHFASYPFCYFVTLTYNEQYVPKSDTGLNIVSKRDVQLFIKRLRKLANYEEIFYFCASEYGPTSLRPHYHLLFGFDSSELAENFPRFVSESWVTYVDGSPFSNGFVDVQSVVVELPNTLRVIFIAIRTYLSNFENSRHSRLALVFRKRASVQSLIANYINCSIAQNLLSISLSLQKTIPPLWMYGKILKIGFSSSAINIVSSLLEIDLKYIPYLSGLVEKRSPLFLKILAIKVPQNSMQVSKEYAISSAFPRLEMILQSMK